MLLFSSALVKHKLKFIRLSECMEHLTLAATWSEAEWGYIRNKGVEFRESVLDSMKKQVFIGLFADKPVAMFALFDHEFHPELIEINKLLPKTYELMYVYVEKNYRGIGFGKQVVEEAKRLTQADGADMILLDTLKPGLNRMYEKQGAQVICEGHLFSHPTDVLAIKM